MCSLVHPWNNEYKWNCWEVIHCTGILHSLLDFSPFCRKLYDQTGTVLGLVGGGLAKSCLTPVTLWTIALQAPLSRGFPRQDYWIRWAFGCLILKLEWSEKSLKHDKLMTWKMCFKLIYSSVRIFTTVYIRTRTHLTDVCGCVHAYMFASFGCQGFLYKL